MVHDPAEVKKNTSNVVLIKDMIRKSEKRNHLWAFKEIEGFSSDEIIGRLHQFGVILDQKEFLNQIKAFYSACQLAESWTDKYTITASSFDLDFIWMSCIILWKQLAPDVINSEKIDDLIQEGYDSLEQDECIDACHHWLNVWKHLKTIIPPEMSRVEEADKVLADFHSIHDCCQALAMELWNIGLDDEKYHDTRIQFCEEFCHYFPNSYERIIVNMQCAIANSSYAIGDIEKGEKTYRNLIKEHPTNAWGYIGWGDVYADGTINSLIKADHEKAKKIYELALNKGMDDEDVLWERLEELNALMNKRDW